MSARILIPLAVAAALAAPVAANADAYPGQPAGDWLFRLGVSQINPKHDNAYVDGLGTIAVDSDVSPTFNVTYMITDHIGTELLLAYPFTHGVDVWPNDGSAKTRLESVDVLPPTLTLQWHFNPTGTWRPYIGAGVNYGMYSNEKARGALKDLGINKVTLDDSFGFAGDIGMDVGFAKNWFMNADVKWLEMQPKAKAELAAGGSASIGKVKIDPIVAGLHVGYRWGAPAPLPVAAPAPAPVAAPPPPPPPAAPVDSDNDGVADTADKCPGTPAGTKVDSVGCPLEQTLKLLFDFNSAELRPESITELERVVKFMNDVPFAKTLIEGHTDSVGNDAYNMKLSDRRAKAVFDYLTSRGVDPSRLSSVGKGESAPIADNKTEEGRQQNRRVMLIRTDSGS